MSLPVILVESDPRWPVVFAAERRRLIRGLVPYVLAVEHVGSTAVQGLPAKPTVDILLGLYRLSDAARVIPRMEKLGYAYLANYKDTLPERRLFRTPADLGQPSAFNVHAVETASGFYERHLLFRDWLRAHPEDRDAYGKLKRELAARFPEDHDAYTEAKTPFVRQIEEKAFARARPKPAEVPSAAGEQGTDG
jgi:GrpB-like predicted nucleotidyltransferase (UPF0157 family)